MGKDILIYFFNLFFIIIFPILKGNAMKQLLDTADELQNYVSIIKYNFNHFLFIIVIYYTSEGIRIIDNYLRFQFYSFFRCLFHN